LHVITTTVGVRVSEEFYQCSFISILMYIAVQRWLPMFLHDTLGNIILFSFIKCHLNFYFWFQAHNTKIKFEVYWYPTNLKCKIYKTQNKPYLWTKLFIDIICK